jgi:hypothetical protein
VTRRRGLLTLVLSAWLSGLVLAAEALSFESPFAPRHPGAEAMPGLEPPADLCEPLFAEQGCTVREDLSPEQHRELERLLEERGREVERWRAERRPALLTAGWWLGPWPLFAVLWTGLAALAAGRVRAGRSA